MFLLFVLFGIVLLGILGFIIWKLLSTQEHSALDLRLLLIKVSKPEAGQEGQDRDIHKAINFSEQLFVSLLSLKEPFVFEAAVKQEREEIFFYAAVPHEKVEFAARQIQGLFPDAQIDQVDDYTIFVPGGASKAAQLALKDSSILPLRSYEESETDTFAQTLSNMSKLAEAGEGAAIQILVRPAPKNYVKSVYSALESLKKGGKLATVLKAGSLNVKDIGKELGKAFGSNDKKKDEIKFNDDEAIKVVQSKISKPIFSVNVRVVASAADEDRADDILTSLLGSYGQFNAPVRNSLVAIEPRNQKKLLYRFSFREYDGGSSMVLNSAELASLFHLPTFSTDIPRIKWLHTREAPPPDELPESGIIIGDSMFRGEKKSVRITDEDRRRHLYIIGQTGTGKSGLQANMITQDIVAGKGVCVIDPHGDLVDYVLSVVPKDRIDDVIVFDPGDIERPLGLNMLEHDFDRPEQRTFIVNEMQSIFNTIFKGSEESMGPQFQQYMRNSMLLLMEDMPNEDATLVDLPRIFTDAEYRKRKIARIKNPVVIDFWEKEASKTTGDYGLQNMTPYITSKFGNFIANDYIRPIIGQAKSAFNFREVMDNGKILLVRLSKGRIGDINAQLLGLIITGKILMSALARGEMDEKDRRDFYFYIDEFQNFTTDSIAVILAEARKYRLELILAHQYIQQLSDNIREAVFGNVGSLISFRVGTTDTETLVKQFNPPFTERDLINIENQNAFIRILIKGQPTKPFNIKTRFYEKGSKEVAAKLKELSRLTYGRTNAEVEAEVLERLRA